ncbi:type II toxin-antitoxin system VapC family toxin [Methanobrevibacter sp. DSM 116169]|uniref:type II toxin-antitoxin system VapC family toxin n=1 Tax=Methanobrevibacter sp. DSM 116169 TaxID=3242727 RepID=UPI0038FC38F8
MEIYYVLDASAFINGFHINNNFNFTISEITEEVKDMKSKLLLEEYINTNKLIIKNPSKKYIDDLEKIVSESGDVLRLSVPDKKIVALALEFSKENKNVKVITDDYTIQNVLKILNIPFKGIITEGINEVYNWKKICMGCKKSFPVDYSFDDCDVCGSKVYKKRIKTGKN